MKKTTEEQHKERAVIADWFRQIADSQVNNWNGDFAIMCRNFAVSIESGAYVEARTRLRRHNIKRRAQEAARLGTVKRREKA